VSVLILAVALPSVGEEVPWDFARLMAELAQVQTSRARYSEVRRIAALRQPLALSGNLYYSRPARVEKHQLLPFREVIRIDQEQLSVERGGKTRTIALTSAPLIAALVESLRATLAGDGAELERLFAVRVQGARERWTLKLVPRDTELAGVIDSISIAGSGTRVSRIEILEPGGDSSVMTIHQQS
jgi:Outer membrane lipoprotein carrier protein LolA-like